MLNGKPCSPRPLRPAEPAAEPAPQPADRTPAAPRKKAERWAAEKRQAFKLFGPHTLYLAAQSVMIWLTTQPVGGGEVKSVRRQSASS